MAVKVSERVKAVPPSGIRRLFDLAQRTSGVISLAIGEPDLVTPVHIREAAKKALDEGYTHYTPNAGFLELRRALAEKLKRENGVEVDPESEVIVTVGGTGALFLATLVLVDPGDEVLVPDPGFVTYLPCITLAGGKAVPVQLREEENFRMLPEEVERRVTPRTRCVIVNSPENPTGSVLLRGDLEAIAEIAIRRNLSVISDEVYEKFLYDGAEHFSIAAISGMEDRTVTVNSFSKTYAMTGWRVGYAAAEKTLTSEMVKIQQNIAANAPAVAQMAALAALRGPQHCVEEMVREYDRRRLLTVKRLGQIEGVSCRAPKGSFYIFPNITALKRPSVEVAEVLLREGKVATVPGVAFGTCGEGYLRLCYAKPAGELERALDGVEEALRRLRKG